MLHSSESACRYKVVAYLKPKFATPADASEHYFSQPLVETTANDDPDKHLSEMSAVFSSLCHVYFGLDVPKDFVVLSAKAMIRLHEVKRSNVLYDIAKGCGEMRPDKSDSRFPTTQMPMGLLEYMAGFFTAEAMRKVQLSHIVWAHLNYRYKHDCCSTTINLRLANGFLYSLADYHN